MAQMSNYLKDKLVNHVFRNIPYVQPTNVYVALYSSDPTSADVGSEIIGNGYTRMVSMFDAPVSGSGTTQNELDVVFPSATIDWVTVTHVGVRDAEVGGNLLSYQVLSTPVTVLATNNFRIADSQLTLIMS